MCGRRVIPSNHPLYYPRSLRSNCLISCFPPPDWYLLICPPVKLKSTYTPLHPSFRPFSLCPSLSLLADIHIIFVLDENYDSSVPHEAFDPRKLISIRQVMLSSSIRATSLVNYYYFTQRRLFQQLRCFFKEQQPGPFKNIQRIPLNRTLKSFSSNLFFFPFSLLPWDVNNGVKCRNVSPSLKIIINAFQIHLSQTSLTPSLRLVSNRSYDHKKELRRLNCRGKKEGGGEVAVDYTGESRDTYNICMCV